MNEHVLRFRVGVVVLSALGILVFLFVIFGARPQFLRTQYPVKIRFPAAIAAKKFAIPQVI